MKKKLQLSIIFLATLSLGIGLGKSYAFEISDVFSPRKQTPTVITMRGEEVTDDSVKIDESIAEKAEKEIASLEKKEKELKDSKLESNLDIKSRPDKFEKSNNLIKKSGSFKIAEGELMIFEGRVTDAFGVPISNAIIRIWQTNSAGEYHNLISQYSDFIDHNFKMSGETTTDNLGRYSFVSIVPGFYKDRSPHINMIIIHKDFGEIITEVYFKDHPLNKKDKQYLSYNEEDREMLTASVRPLDPLNKDQGKIFTFDIVMDGTHQYKSF